MIVHYKTPNFESIMKARGDRKIVFTNGCFDILTAAHVHMFDYINKAYCGPLNAKLIVGLNSDHSVRALKPGRPITPEQERAEVLAALHAVDSVIIFNDPTPEKLIKELRPNALVKGGDYNPRDIAGATFVYSYGGIVGVTPSFPGQSTTTKIMKIQDLLKKGLIDGKDSDGLAPAGGLLTVGEGS